MRVQYWIQYLNPYFNVDVRLAIAEYSRKQSVTQNTILLYVKGGV